MAAPRAASCAIRWPCLEGLDRGRVMEQEALESAATVAEQDLELRGVLHAFGDDAQAECMSEGDDGPDDRQAVRVGRQVADEGAVDLQLVQR